MSQGPVPKQMHRETLDAKKGWPNPHAVDFEAKFDPSIQGRVPRGAVVHLSSSGTYLLGCNDTSVNPMPLFCFQASDEPDVVNPHDDPATTRGGWVPVNPTGVAMTLVASGAYELYTTEYVGEAADYSPNDKLTANVAGGDDPGVLRPGTLGTHVICGVVSRGRVDNGYGFDAVAFWPGLYPVYPG